MRSLYSHEFTAPSGGFPTQEFVNMSMYYGAAVGTALGAIAGAIKIGMEWNILYAPIGFMGGGLVGAAAGIGCSAIAAIPLSAIFCPPDFSKPFVWPKIT